MTGMREYQFVITYKIYEYRLKNKCNEIGESF